MTITLEQQPKPASTATLALAGRADHSPYIPGGIEARLETPITDYLWSADPPERTPGRKAEAG